MRKEELGPFGAWALGVLLFIATLLVIRWTVDFVTWSTLDSGWAQAIGSVAALGVAIYVMSRQNAHSARLIVDADTLALRRRAAAVNAIVKRAHHAADLAYDLGSIPRGSIPDVARLQARFKGARRSIEVIVEKISDIPLYELGSYDIVDSLFAMQGTLIQIERVMQRLIDEPGMIGMPDIVYTFFRAANRIEDAHKQFVDGAKSFSRSHDHSSR